MIQVSVDHGETWNMAQLPPVNHEQFYSILAANDDMVFMHVDEPGGTIDQLSVLLLITITKIMKSNIYVCFQIQDLGLFTFPMTVALCIQSHWSGTFTQ